MARYITCNDFNNQTNAYVKKIINTIRKYNINGSEHGMVVINNNANLWRKFQVTIHYSNCAEKIKFYHHHSNSDIMLSPTDFINPQCNYVCVVDEIENTCYLISPNCVNLAIECHEIKMYRGNGDGYCIKLTNEWLNKNCEHKFIA